MTNSLKLPSHELPSCWKRQYYSRFTCIKCIEESAFEISTQLQPYSHVDTCILWYVLSNPDPSKPFNTCRLLSARAVFNYFGSRFLFYNTQLKTALGDNNLSFITSFVIYIVIFDLGLSSPGTIGQGRFCICVPCTMYSYRTRGCYQDGMYACMLVCLY